MNFLQKLFKKKHTQTTFCYCPECENELVKNGQLINDDGEIVQYCCSNCGHTSLWNFNTPAPILL